MVLIVLSQLYATFAGCVNLGFSKSVNFFESIFFGPP